MRVLLLAPDHSGTLPDQPREVADLQSVLDVEVATNGEKTLLATIRNAKFDGVWISSHATSDGVMLEGNEVLDPAALAQYLAAVGAKWLVINSCESFEFVDRVQRYYPLDIVAASIKALGDRPAWRTAALIARHLAQTQDLREALRLASPGGAAPYRFWPSPVSIEGSLTVNIEQKLQQSLTDIRAEIQRWQLETERSNADVKVGLARLEGRIEVAESLAEAVQRKIEKSTKPDPVLSTRMMRVTVGGIYLIGVLLFLLLLLLANGRIG